MTGGTGFIGSATIRALLRKGDHIRCLDNNSRGSLSRLADLSADIDFMDGDIRDRDFVLQATRGMDSVLHLAAINGTSNFYSDPETVLEVAVMGITHILQACKINDVRELLVMSSSEVYQLPPRIPTDENVPLCIPDPFNPRFSYGAGKIISEVMAIHAKKHFDRVLIVRPHNVYGPNMGYDHVVPEIILKIQNQILISSNNTVVLRLKGNGNHTRSFIFISDMIDGLLKVLQKGEKLAIYHIGTDQEISIHSLAEQIVKIFGISVEWAYTDVPQGETPRRCPDIKKLKGLGFVPLVPLHKGLEETVRWYQQHPKPASGLAA